MYKMFSKAELHSSKMPSQNLPRHGRSIPTPSNANGTRHNRVFGLLSIVFLLCPVVATAEPSGDVLTTIKVWSEAWNNHSFDRYISCYSRGFSADNRDFEDWTHLMMASFARDLPRLRIDSVKIKVAEETARVQLDMQYTEDTYIKTGRKQLDMLNENGEWQIVSERWLALEALLPATKNVIQEGEMRRISEGPNFIEDISFLSEEGTPERLCVNMAYYAIPGLSAEEGSEPQLTIHFHDNIAWSGRDQMQFDGQMLKSMQARYSGTSKMTELVVELDRSGDFVVRQLYDQARSSYCIAIKVDEPQTDRGRGPTPVEQPAAFTADSNQAAAGEKTQSKLEESAAAIEQIQQIEQSSQVANTDTEKELGDFFFAWLEAWEKTAGSDGDLTEYMARYSEQFRAGRYDKISWQNDKKIKNRKRDWIKGEILALQIISVEDNGEKAKVSMELHYQAPNYSEILNKIFVVQKEVGQWKIFAEKTRLKRSR